MESSMTSRKTVSRKGLRDTQTRGASIGSIGTLRSMLASVARVDSPEAKEKRLAFYEKFVADRESNGFKDFRTGCASDDGEFNLGCECNPVEHPAEIPYMVRESSSDDKPAKSLAWELSDREILEIHRGIIAQMSRVWNHPDYDVQPTADDDNDD